MYSHPALFVRLSCDFNSAATNSGLQDALLLTLRSVYRREMKEKVYSKGTFKVHISNFHEQSHQQKECAKIKKKTSICAILATPLRDHTWEKNLDISLGYHFLKWPSTSVFVQRVHACSFIFMHYYFFVLFLFLFFVFYREAVHHWQHKLSTGSSLYFLYDFCFPSRSLFLYFLMSSLSCLTSLFLSLPLSIIFFFSLSLISVLISSAFFFSFHKTSLFFFLSLFCLSLHFSSILSL